MIISFSFYQGRIKDSACPGAVPNAGPLQTNNQLTTPTNCGPPKLRARFVLSYSITVAQPYLLKCLRSVNMAAIELSSTELVMKRICSEMPVQFKFSLVRHCERSNARIPVLGFKFQFSK